MPRRAAWGLDLGQGGLKAVRAHVVGDRIEVLAFDRLEYGAAAVESETDRDSAIRQSLATFLGRNEIGKDIVFASTSAHNALVRFIKLPPVDRKNLPNLIRYEAHQQIPFPLDEVIWDYEAMDRGFMPGEEIEVGIFAMRKEVIHRFLSNLALVNLEVELLQVAPLALFNFVSYEMPPEQGATVVIDVGADDTDLVVVSKQRVWTRNLPIAGNDLTAAVGKRFEIPFEKAEVLKRKASKSKYRNEIYEAMKPVLKGLVDEVQRSVGFYKGLHPDTRIEKVLALGNAFKLPGLGKFVMSSLQYPTAKLGGLDNFQVNNAMRVNLYRENPMSFGVALGLAAQACGKGAINTNLLPREIINRRILRGKRYAGLVAAGAVAGFVGLSFLNASGALHVLKGSLKGEEKAPKVQGEITSRAAAYNTAKGTVPKIVKGIEDIANSVGDRSDWPFIIRKIAEVIDDEPPLEEQKPPDMDKWKDGQVVEEPELLFVGRNDTWIHEMSASEAGIKGAWAITLKGECRKQSFAALEYLEATLLKKLRAIPCFLDVGWPPNYGWPDRADYRVVDVNGVVIGSVGTTGSRTSRAAPTGRGASAPSPADTGLYGPPREADVTGRDMGPGRSPAGVSSAGGTSASGKETAGPTFIVPYTPFVVTFTYDPRKKQDTLKLEREAREMPQEPLEEGTKGRSEGADAVGEGADEVGEDAGQVGEDADEETDVAAEPEAGKPGVAADEPADKPASSEEPAGNATEGAPERVSQETGQGREIAGSSR